MRKRTIFIGLITLLLVVGASLLLVTRNVKKTTNSSNSPRVKATPVYLVSLGDSVAAGDGLPITSSSVLATSCAQSDEAYPFLVAKAKGLILKQFACSGATVTAGVTGPQIVGSQTLPAQLTAATPYIKNSDVLITIGANDVKWESMLYACATSNCETATNLATFQQGLTQLSNNLTSLAQTLQNLHPKTVVFNTYYPLLNNSDTCLQPRGITTDKITWVNTRESELNATIKTVADAYKYKTVAIAFNGHLLCDASSWLQNLTDLAPFHPTASGQVAIANEDAQLL